MTSLTKIDEPSIIKTDHLGRMQTSAARRERLLAEFERSGLSAAKFAALAGLKYSTFAAWVHRRRQSPVVEEKGSAKPTDPVQWLEAVVEQTQPPGLKNPAVLVLQLPGGARVEVADEKQAALAAMLLRSLVKSC